jgi:hypothetical protein
MKLKLHTAEAGGLSFDPLSEVVRLKLRLHATEVGGLQVNETNFASSP